jgi:hypothetical protein
LLFFFFFFFFLNLWVANLLAWTSNKSSTTSTCLPRKSFLPLQVQVPHRDIYVYIYIYISPSRFRKSLNNAFLAALSHLILATKWIWRNKKSHKDRSHVYLRVEQNEDEEKVIKSTWVNMIFVVKLIGNFLKNHIPK